MPRAACGTAAATNAFLSEISCSAALAEATSFSSSTGRETARVETAAGETSATALQFAATIFRDARRTGDPVQGRIDKFQWIPKTTHWQSFSPFSSAETSHHWARAATGTTAVLDTSTGGPQPQIFPRLQQPWRCVPAKRASLSALGSGDATAAETWRSRSFAG